MKASTEKGYAQKIRARMKQVGTYRREFELTIERLAKVYMRIDRTEEEFTKSGGSTIVEKVTKAGTNWEKNPLLQEIDNLGKLALEMEKELGLTPSSLRKVNEAAMPGNSKTENDDPLALALGELKLLKNTGS